jgi:copper chaperone
LAQEKTNLHVEGMSCQHCVNSVTQAVGALKGVADVVVDLQNKKAAVAYDSQLDTLQNTKEAIEDQGYEVK